jgi:hypothetical protein
LIGVIASLPRAEILHGTQLMLPGLQTAGYLVAAR